MNLNVVDFNKQPKQNRVLGLFPNCKLNAEQVRNLLNATNPHMNVGCWTILSSKTTDKGAHIAFGLNKLQFDMLTANRFKMHFGVGCALFKDISRKENTTRRNNADANDMEIQTTDLDLSDDDDDVTITKQTHIRH